MFIEEVDGKMVIILWVTAGDGRPYKVPDQITAKHKNSSYYIRYNSNSIVAKGEYELELMNLANRIPFDDRGNIQAKPEDISMLLVRDFLTQTRSKLLEQIEISTPLRILEQMDLLTGPVERMLIKNVALMLFSYTPEKFFPETQVDIVIYPKGKDEAPDNFIEIEPLKGPIHLIIKKTLEYLKTMVIKQKTSKLSSQEESVKTYNYPYQALEEAVVNSLYYRSYQEREPVEISIMPDQIEIISYTGPDRSIKLQDLKEGKRVRARRYRNRKLGDFLKELNLTEGRGTGLPTIHKELKKNGSPKAEFDVDEDRTYFLISIPCHKEFVCQELAVDESGQIGGQIGGQMNKNRIKILNLVIANAHITRKELQQQTGFAQSAIQKHLAILVKEGYLKKEGKTRSSYWIILKRN